MLNFSKQLVLKWFIFLLSLNFIGLQSKDLQHIKVEDLHIFYILQNAKIVISQDVLEKDDSAKEIGVTSLNLINKEITLLEEIIDGLNKGHLMFVGYKFLRVCNFFKEYNRIAPRDLREFKKKLLKFDGEIQKYLTRKESLSAVEIELCEKISDFNKVLLACFLRYEFYGIDIFDRIIDTVIFKPFEWAQEHPYITLAFITLVAAVACYFYFFYSPKFLKNQNSNVDVTQFFIFLQKGATCGARAAYCIICFLRGRGDKEITYKLANDKEEFERRCEEWSRIPGMPQGLRWLDGENIRQIILHYNNSLPEGERFIFDDFSNFVLIGDSRLLERGNFANLNDIDIINDGDYQNADPAAGRQFVHREGKRTRLTNGQSQYVILCTDRSETDKDGNLRPVHKDSGGHWLPFAFIPDKQARGGVKVFTADSLCNVNRTNSYWLNRLHHIFMHGN